MLQVVNHGVPHYLMDDITRIGKEFFQLPAEEKEKYAIRDFQGYGQIFVVSEEQKRDWGDWLGLIISPQQSRNLSTRDKDFIFAHVHQLGIASNI